MSDWLPMLHFQRPLWLWGLALLPLLALAWWRLTRRGDPWRDAVDPHLLPHLIEPAPGRGWTGPVLGMLVVALGLLALAGPGWRQEAQPRWQSHAPLVVAFDLSSAMTTPDLPPSRLLQARAKLSRLLAQRVGGDIGLVAWAEDAFTVAPLTGDASNVALFVDALSPEVMPVDGQRPARAIAQASALLRQAGFSSGDILLLSGTADAAARDAAAQALAQGYRVSVLGLGTAEGAFHRDRGGQLLRAVLEADALRALAQAGGGRYAALTADDADLQALGVLQPPAEALVQDDAAGARGWLDQGYWLLPALLLLVALGFRRGGHAVGAVLLAVLLVPATVPPVQAADGSLWQRADQAAQRRLEAGVQAYRAGDFAAAQHAFEGQPGAEAQYNLGNALARQGRYDEAIAAYDRALAARAGMADAQANRAVVEAARRRQQQAGGGTPPPSGDGGSGQNQAQQQGDGEAGRDAPPQDEPGQPAPPSDDRGERGDAPAQEGEPPPQAEDAEAARRQQEADAAQRERMRQALEAQGEAAADEDQAAQQPSAEVREQRQAREAWLRRVPDDPGGLLRAKFQIEHERRRREGR